MAEFGRSSWRRLSELREALGCEGSKLRSTVAALERKGTIEATRRDDDGRVWFNNENKREIVQELRRRGIACPEFDRRLVAAKAKSGSAVP